MVVVVVVVVVTLSGGSCRRKMGRGDKREAVIVAVVLGWNYQGIRDRWLQLKCELLCWQ